MRTDEEASAEWPFADSAFSDHFETPARAYADVVPLLRGLGEARRIARQQLRLYDPYYCRGRTTVELVALGFPRAHILHEKRDFYADVAAGSVPQYDVLLTNPPYSHDHKERLFHFLLDTQRLRAAGALPPAPPRMECLQARVAAAPLVPLPGARRPAAGHV